MKTESEKQKDWDSYLYPNTNVLINNFNITNQSELDKKENEIVLKQLLYLYLKPLDGKFDSNHLCNIHKRIFDEIYPFAGKYRICTMQKNSVFCNPELIEEYLNDCLYRMNKEINEVYSRDSLANFIAKYYYELIYIHPFREGNGRSIRVFIRDFVVEKSKDKFFGQYDIDYTKMDKQNLLLGTAFKYLYPSNLEMEFKNSLILLEKSKIK